MIKHRKRNIIEALEARTLFASIAVTTMGDTGPGSLRAAIASAQTNDTIDLTGVTGTITLTSQITIDKNLTITGPGAGDLAISGNDATNLFYQDGGNVLVTDLTIRNGLANGISAAWNLNYGDAQFERVDILHNTGTAINVNYHLATLQFTDCNVMYNNNPDGVASAVSTFANATFTNCNISNNSATAPEVVDQMFGGTHPGTGWGGAISFGQATLTITNSTMANNTLTAEGSGSFAGGAAISIYNGAAYLVMTNSTITGNTVTADDQRGAGIYAFNNPHVTITNTIIAGNNGADDLQFENSSMTSGGHNLIGAMASNATFVHGTNGDLVGTAASPIDAKLATLADNGGATLTVGLLAGSPAIDAGDDNQAPATDQRGTVRTNPTDIGAFEGFLVTNHAPAWTTTSLDAAAMSVPYSMIVATTDSDNDVRTLSLVNPPAWLTLTDLGNGTARLSGTPSIAHYGSTNITLRVDDGTVHADTTLALSVSAPIAALNTGTLSVNGTNGIDDVQIRMRGTDTIRITRNGTIRNYAVGDVAKIVINGFGGDDNIITGIAGLGVSITGGAGNDTLSGADGADTLYGEDGNDVIRGYEGDDRLYGGAGNDTIDAGSGKNRAWGGEDNDTLIGGNSADRLWGENGNDQLTGKAQADALDGGNGTDSSDTDITDALTSIESQL